MNEQDPIRKDILRPPKDETLILAYKGLVISITSNSMTREQAEAMLESWEEPKPDQ